MSNHNRTVKMLKVMIIAGLILAVVAGNVHASSTLRVIGTSCSTLTSQTSITSTPIGTILFTCGTNPAVTVNMPGSTVPSFRLPTGYLILTLVPHFAGAQNCLFGIPLISGHAIHFSSKVNSFDYCTVYYVTPPVALAGFTVTWSQ